MIFAGFKGLIWGILKGINFLLLNAKPYINYNVAQKIILLISKADPIEMK